MSSNNNPVSHPSHYNSGKIEVIEAIEDWGLNFHKGNAVKYIARAGKKDPKKHVEDLEKARWYLQREIERLKADAEGREPVRPNDMVERGKVQAHSPPDIPYGISGVWKHLHDKARDCSHQCFVPHRTDDCRDTGEHEILVRRV